MSSYYCQAVVHLVRLVLQLLGEFSVLSISEVLQYYKLDFVTVLSLNETHLSITIHCELRGQG